MSGIGEPTEGKRMMQDSRPFKACAYLARCASTVAGGGHPELRCARGLWSPILLVLGLTKGGSLVTTERSRMPEFQAGGQFHDGVWGPGGTGVLPIIPHPVLEAQGLGIHRDSAAF